MFDYQHSCISWNKIKWFPLQHKSRNRHKVIQSLQLHISDLISSQSRAKRTRGLGYTCFLSIWATGKFGENGPKYCRSCGGTHQMQSKAYWSIFHIRQDHILVSGSSMIQGVPVYQVWRYFGNSGKLGQNTPNHMSGHKKITQSLQLHNPY